MIRVKFLAPFLIFLFVTLIQAQERPPIAIYTPKNYGAENQNWSICQSSDKYIYVANNRGLLEFNGANWQLYKSPNETIVRSVNVIDDLIYTGCNSEFGYWKRNEFGLLSYTSLSQQLKIQFLEDEEFWSIINIDDFILFQSKKRIYIYNKENETYSFIDSESTIYKMFEVNGDIYFQKLKKGVFKIENGKSVLVTNDAILNNYRLVNIFSNKDELLIETENNGFYILDSNKILKWDIPANEILSKFSVYRSIRLKDNSFVLGTRSNGILHLTREGNIDYTINNVDGLSNNTVLSIFEDVENNIWLGLDNGINCLNINSPFSVYNDEYGKIGTVYTSANYNNIMYLGTNQGLFYKPIESNKEFELVKNTEGQVWCLVEFDNTLFCGHDSGTFIVNNNQANLAIDVEGTWNIKPIKGSTNMLLQGNYNGLNVIQKINGNWVLKNKIKGFDISSKFFEIFNENEIFVSHEYRGVFKIQTNKDFSKAIKITKDTIVDKGLNASLIKTKGDILYAYKEGVFKYDSIKRSFIKDSLFGSLYQKEEYSSGKLVFNDNTNTLWNISSKDINFLSYDGLSGMPKINKIPFSESIPRGLSGYENISYLNNRKYLIGTSSGYVVVDLNKLNNKPYEITINSISKSGINSLPEMIDKSSNGNFKNKENNIEFKYSVAEFEKYLDTEYQYQLEGIYDQWSNWSSNPEVLFSNLPYGDYTFNVKAKVGNQISSNIASYSFEIERPWSLSNIMIGLYALAVMLLSLFIHTVYKNYYKKQRERILLKTTRELELRKMENQQQLMQFNNENLRQDIENKNRELGISTMSLIKKNEFLNGLKKELKQVQEVREVKQVIKIIDRNLNDSDDWHLFEEAFNNADKDFLKKIKTLHPSLTSNDLRLCAYLRLNLSSKEIAPLLNISPRSVEVKRYRLRKKIGLSHESNLSDYILEI